MRMRVLLVVCLFLGSSVSSFAQANIVRDFLNRYRTSNVNLPPPSAPGQNQLEDMIRSGVIPLSVSDLINLTLRNNLDLSVDRLTPFSTRLLIGSLYRPFEPTLRLSASVERDTSPSRSHLTGARSLSQLSHNYTIGFGQTLETGTE